MNKPLPTVIAISGPPRAGKDTSAGILKGLIERNDLGGSTGKTCGLHRMSRPLKDLAAQMLPKKKFSSEELKDTALNAAGTTFRDLQIDLFRLGARRLGSDWLGHQYLKTIHSCRWLDFILMPDAGRPDEIQVLLDHEVPLKQIKLYRKGTTFEGDAREDFSIPLDGSNPVCIINNDSSLSDLRAALQSALFSFKILPPP